MRKPKHSGARSASRVAKSAIGGGPGPRSRALLDRLKRVENPGLTAIEPGFPVVWERALGTRVWDVDGRQYLDLTAAFGVAAVGHSHPSVVETINRQAALLTHAMGDVHPARTRIELLERLAILCPGNLAVSHLGLSGADAAEAALKTAFLATGRPGILAFYGGYHGLSYGTRPLASVHYRDPFAPQLSPHVRHAPFAGPSDSDFSVTESIIASGEIGAVVVEPVQGRGGVRPAPPGLLPALARLCRQHGALLIVDEIATGLGRTGRWFAIEEEDVVPDLLLVGKALGGGLPISAAVAGEAVMAAWRGRPAPAILTSTFLGHPLAAAAALTVLDVIEREELPARAASLGAALVRDLEAALAGIPGVSGIRGRGLMAGIVLADPESGAPDGKRAWEVVVELCADGILVLTAGEEGEVIELTPPLVVSEAELAHAVEAIAGALRRVPPRGARA